MNHRRGLTLVELLMAVMITAMVGAGISGMLGAVSSGVGTRKDNRDIMVLAHAAQCRLAAYLATANCALEVSGGDLTLWLDDSRVSGTVHATEIRWLRFIPATGELIVEYVAFPDAWTQTACELADDEFDSNADWETVRLTYSGKGLLESRALVDHLAAVVIVKDELSTHSARHIAFDLEFQGDHAVVPVEVSGTIQSHEAPVN